MINKALFSSNSEEWATPQNLFNQLNEEFHFTLDCCATKENAKCEKFYTKADDGLSKSWEGEIVWCNPPYGKNISKWVRKADEESKHATIVMLLPARTDTAYFHDFIYRKHEIIFLRGRLHFNESKQSAPFPSMIVVMRNKEKGKRIKCYRLENPETGLGPYAELWKLPKDEMDDYFSAFVNSERFQEENYRKFYEDDKYKLYELEVEDALVNNRGQVLFKLDKVKEKKEIDKRRNK